MPDRINDKFKRHLFEDTPFVGLWELYLWSSSLRLNDHIYLYRSLRLRETIFNFSDTLKETSGWKHLSRIDRFTNRMLAKIEGYQYCDLLLIIDDLTIIGAYQKELIDSFSESTNSKIEILEVFDGMQPREVEVVFANLPPRLPPISRKYQPFDLFSGRK